MIVGGVGLAVTVVGLVIGLMGSEESLDQFFRSYLFGMMFWLGIPLGSLGVLMLHNMTGGPWGYVIRRILEAAIKTMPLMAILFVPILFGIHNIFEWSHADVVAADPVLQHKSLYLNVPFFIGRAVFYFAVWTLFGTYVTREMRRLEDLGGSVVTRRLQGISAIGILFLFLTATFASFDWMMSLEPHWFSTAYGLIWIVGSVLATFAFAITMLNGLGHVDNYVDQSIKPQYLHDLGNFLFAFMLLWTYVAISQFLIIWAGNLPEEVPWYFHRTEGAWIVIPIALGLLHFFAPFILLLLRAVKRNRRRLAAVAVLILSMHAVDTYWQIAPSFPNSSDGGFQFHLSWMDISAFIGIGGIWFTYFLRILEKSSFLPLNVAVPKEELEEHV
jgi:hypothetical protein